MNRLLRHGAGILPSTAARLSASAELSDDVLIVDVRAGLTPTDMVERKLMNLLRGASVAGSHVRMFGVRRRGRANN